MHKYTEYICIYIHHTYSHKYTEPMSIFVCVYIIHTTREVVVKLLQMGATPERQERFLREAKIVAGLQVWGGYDY